MTPTEESTSGSVAAEASAMAAQATAETQAQFKTTGKMKYGYYWGTGRRKTSIARVRIRPGEGKFVINSKEIDDFFRVDRYRNDVVAPLMATGTRKRFDVFVKVHGGGTTGQTGAIVLGLARALKIVDGAYEQPLRDGHYLTRDAREVERKKYGQAGARKRFQFSKR